MFQNYDDCISEHSIHIDMSLTFDSFTNELWLFNGVILWQDFLIVLGVVPF